MSALNTCDLCSKTGADLSLMNANHKELGRIMICRDCWKELYQKNRIVAGTTGSSGFSCAGKCASCPHA